MAVEKTELLTAFYVAKRFYSCKFEIIQRNPTMITYNSRSIKNFHKKFGSNCIYLLGDTEDKRKINWYRKLISLHEYLLKEQLVLAAGLRES